MKARPRRIPSPRMTCPECGDLLDKVIDTRHIPGGIRRRRTCLNGHRIVTVEHIEKAA